jgi:hypothetical protein
MNADKNLTLSFSSAFICAGTHADAWVRRLLLFCS